MFKKIILFAIALSIFGEVFARPMPPYPVEVTQGDGTVVTVQFFGDEKLHWVESLDGYTLIKNSKLDLVFAVKDAKGNLQPSSILYRGQDLAAYSAADKAAIALLDKGLTYSKKQVETAKKVWTVIENASGEGSTDKASGASKATAPVVTPVVGNKTALVILAEFQDIEFTYSKEEFELWANQIGYSANGATGSVRDFFYENSYGKLEVAFTFVGPVTCSHNASYYANENRWQDWAKEVAQLADSLVDYSQFAINGALPFYHIIYAGYASMYSSIWPHKWGIWPILTLDEVRISTYSCSQELDGNSGSTMAGIGAFCHEVTHSFGSPDYYDTDYRGSGGDYDGTGIWDCMASGTYNNESKTPPHINMFQKILFGWVNPIQLYAPRTVTDMPNSVDSAMAYFVKVNTNGEMYLLENRQKKGFDAYVPASGLLVYHVHQDALSGNVDNTSHPQGCYVVAAGRLTAIPTASPSSYDLINSASAVFPGSKNKTSFTGSTSPRMFSWEGSSGIAIENKPITDIVHNADNGTISFRFRGGADLPTREIDLDRTDTFFFKNVGFGSTAAKCDVVVNSIGTLETGALKIALSGKDATAFILSDTVLESIPAFGLSTFSVSVANRSELGTYFASITVSGDSIASPQSFNLQVNIVKASGVSVTPPAFKSKTETQITVFASKVRDTTTMQVIEYNIGLLTSVNSVIREWQSDTVFDGLEPGTKYYVFARSAENDHYRAGTAGRSSPIITNGEQSAIEDLLTAERGGLLVWISNGKFFVKGLTAGEKWQIYSVSGVLLYSGTAVGNNVVSVKLSLLPLPEHGVYIIQQKERFAKIFF
ncbi:MAG: M6 family metalloprotease domain-containing protein [Bacteroidales bacterium]|jgi:M6 family metalloprotease-like protein|nr:M6 family metalloprotease domain-containing protein [Bacteroidales bacterium]